MNSIVTFAALKVFIHFIAENLNGVFPFLGKKADTLTPKPFQESFYFTSYLG